MQKTARKKHQIFEKWDDFENRPSCKGYSPCKGYRLCKMGSLGQKFKIKYSKYMRNTNSTRTLELICAKNRSKNTKYSRNETILKISHLAKAIAHAKAIAFAHWSVWVKNSKFQKHPKNHSARTLDLLCAKDRSKKHQIFEKRDDFENRPSCKGYSPCKG